MSSSSSSSSIFLPFLVVVTFFLVVFVILVTFFLALAFLLFASFSLGSFVGGRKPVFEIPSTLDLPRKSAIRSVHLGREGPTAMCRGRRALR